MSARRPLPFCITAQAGLRSWPLLPSQVFGDDHDHQHESTTRVRGNGPGEATGDRGEGRQLCAAPQALVLDRSGLGDASRPHWRVEPAGERPTRRLTDAEFLLHGAASALVIGASVALMIVWVCPS